MFHPKTTAGLADLHKTVSQPASNSSCSNPSTPQMRMRARERAKGGDFPENTNSLMVNVRNRSSGVYQNAARQKTTPQEQKEGRWDGWKTTPEGLSLFSLSMPLDPKKKSTTIGETKLMTRWQNDIIPNTHRLRRIFSG